MKRILAQRGTGSFMRAACAGVLWFTACAGSDAGSDAAPVQAGGIGGAAVPTATSGAGAGAGVAAAGAGGLGGAGRPAALGGMSAPGRAGTGAAGMPMAAGAGGAGGGGACSPESRDSDGDGAPDCRDMCATDAMKTAPGVCGCGVPDADANMDSTPDCMDVPAEPAPHDPELCKVGPIPDDVRSEYELSDFYTRYASAEGTPIVATDNPVDEAIRRACRIVLDLSSTHPMARQRMRADHIYFIMMAKNEKTVDTPEYRSRGDLDARARGFGNNPGLCAEENVMCERTIDRWRGESICVHEYSHVMHLYVWNRVDPMFNAKVNAAYNNAVRSMRKYANTYAASNAVEYFAEAVQDWYNTNLQSSRGESGDGVHNHINTRAELEEYDPVIYELLGTVLPDVPAYEDCYYYE